jgi:hypothetical protein
MLDPISIGLAFTAAQAAVKSIKSAIQLGKDINEVGGELSKFFLSSATVYSAQSAARMKNSNKSDAELGAQALQTVMQAKKLRDQEKELKELFIYSGNADLWTELLAERTRLIVEQRMEVLRKERIAKETRQSLIEGLQITGALLFLVVALAGIIWGVVAFKP